MKRLMTGVIALVMLLTFTFTGASLAEKKLSVVTTIFPVYDWAREIVGNNDNVEITVFHQQPPYIHAIVRETLAPNRHATEWKMRTGRRTSSSAVPLRVYRFNAAIYPS